MQDDGLHAFDSLPVLPRFWRALLYLVNVPLIDNVHSVKLRCPLCTGIVATIATALLGKMVRPERFERPALRFVV